MAALTAKRATDSRNLGQTRVYKMAGSTTIYAGGLVMLKSDGYAKTAAALASNKGVVGVAMETVVNSGADGAKEITVQEGEFLLGATSIAQVSIGSAVYASDDQTIDETQGSNEPKVGLLTEVVSSTSGWVLSGLLASR